MAAVLLALLMTGLMSGRPARAQAADESNTNRMENARMNLTFDGHGVLTRLENARDGRVWLDGGDCGYEITVNTETGSIWKTTRGKEITLRPRDAEAELTWEETAEGKRLLVRRSHPVNDGVILVTQTVTMTADDAVFGMTIDNRCKDAAVTSAVPLKLTGVTDGAEALNLLWPDKEGKLYSRVMTEESDAPSRLQASYPSLMSMQYLALYSDNESLYFGVHDITRTYKDFSFEAARGQCGISCVQWPFVGAGECKELAPVHLALRGGGWYECADIYRDYLIAGGFVKTYGDMMRDYTGIASACLVKYANRYDTAYVRGQGAPQGMADIARRNRSAYHSPLTIYMGWHEQGFDSRYPDYRFLEAYGGEEGFRQGVEAVHAAGGKVIPYLNLHIADTMSDWYNEKTASGLTKGMANAIQTRHASVLHEQYGTGLDYVAMCPMAPDWQDAIVAAAERVRACGADGLWLDQMMEMPGNLCYNASHGHATPATAYAEGYDSLMARIDEVMRAYGDDYFYCCEGVCDAYIGVIDLCGLMWARLPGSDSTTAQQITRYTMPCRFMGLPTAGAATGSQEQYAHAWTQADGMLCQSQNPLIRRYADLARRYPHIYLDGRYLDVRGLSGIPEGVRAGVLTASDGGSGAIQLFNHGVRPAECCLSMAGTGTVTAMLNAETGKPLECTENGWRITVGAQSAAAVLVEFEQ